MRPARTADAVRHGRSDDLGGRRRKPASLRPRAGCCALRQGDACPDLKFHDRHDARRLFGRWLAQAGAELLADADLIVPVPLTRTRLLSRRFNQSAILAHEVARVAHVKVEPLALLRVRSSKPQVGLSREQRSRNVSGAFAVAPARKVAISGAKIVLVDDVITTGATAEACARALRRAGAASVDVLALVADASVVAG